MPQSTAIPLEPSGARLTEAELPEPEQPDEEPSAQAYVERARSEARDDTWATEHERLFESDLRAKAAQLDFKVGDVDCYSSSCVAELFWPTLREARADFKATLGAPEQTGCLPRLLLTTAGHEDAPEMGSMVLDCATQQRRAARRAGIELPHDSD